MQATSKARLKATQLRFAAAALITVMPAHAQVTIDISKVTCEQFWLRKIANPEKVALWLSGYYNGKKGNTIVDPQKFDSATREITEYCRQNFNITLMQAAEAVMGEKK